MDRTYPTPSFPPAHSGDDRRGARPRDARRAAPVALLALLTAGVGLPVAAPAAVAAPAPDASPTSAATPGAFSGVVPDGVCAVEATVLGGAGGVATDNASRSGGAGARITATFAVLPGQDYAGTVGGGGGAPVGEGADATVGAGGTGGGGAGGNSVPNYTLLRHHGAGGGGLSSLSLGGDLAVLAGGGGGAGGWHSETTEGRGGDGGLPTAPGAAAGTAGQAGKDVPATSVGGGAGGGTDAPGAGGVNAADAGRNGSAGSGGTGGAGGTDATPDAGGGGGGGLFGGGGGASTVGFNGRNGAQGITGGGGGGGSSFVAPSVRLGSSTTAPTGLSAVPGERRQGPGDGPDGAVTLDWVPCAYDLAVTKSADPTAAVVGDTVTWTVVVENLGPDAMTRGDLVDVTDTLSPDAEATLTGISTTGGSNAVLARDPLVCDAAVGEALPDTLTCSRPYEVLGGGGADGERGLDVGETLTLTYTTTATATGEVTNTATVTDRTEGDDNDTATTTVPVTGSPLPDAPTAADDQDLDNAPGTPVTVDVLENDSTTLVPGTVELLTPGTGTPTTTLVVPGEGTWTVDPATGAVTFTPEDGFEGDPTPVTYRAEDEDGQPAQATVTITYVEPGAPAAVDDEDLGNTIGEVVTVDVLANDSEGLDPTTVRLVDPATGDPVTSLVVPGEGSWTVDPGTGAVSFTPQAGFGGNPTPVDYVAADAEGAAVRATVTITYVPAPVPDASPSPSPSVTPAPVTPPTGGSGTVVRPTRVLAATGASVAAGLALAGGLVAAGLGLTTARRRRRS
ncbi:Ig-like domain-containing protein [Cellulomonas marina]|uniref:Conserved repeat domain-containing protein n=1 Tax=Cellulomonas marina TaxID=988821 RepID=A0A1I0X5Z4_9CELL|nr:DUF11 domain-containing protein [Cellulomonas marina]GIG28980.1 hypothetical protein Cma02nite_15800 [Cellulomonas marina]SFA96469.1 conserved repeat domain-containing protein [Cellulomonas marina]